MASDSRLLALPPAERAVLEAAIQRGLVSPDQVTQILGMLQTLRPGSLPSVLGRALPREHMELLGKIYRETQARTSGPHATLPPSSSGRISGTGTVTETVGGPTPSGAFSAAMASGELPPQLGPYTIERELARGGMGVVYVARHTQLDRRVALKVMKGAADEQSVERFHIEAQAAARLRHPNIVGIHDVGKVAGCPYLAMDLIEGKTLKAMLREQQLKPRRAAELTEKLARGVYYAHTQSILHRDIKPENVLLTPEGEPVLTDFGLAKDVSKQAGVTVEGQVMGTPAYMPPEQADGNLDQVDRRSDVYSLGATLYEMLAGKPPFEGSTPMNILVKVLSKDAEPPTKLRQGIHRDLETICLKCLEKDPQQRYGSAQDLAEDLRRFLDDVPIEARPVGSFERIWRRARRNRAVALGISVGVVVVVGALTASTILAQSNVMALEKANREAVAEKAKAEEAQQKAEAAQLTADLKAKEATASEIKATTQANLVKQERTLAEARAILERAYGHLSRQDYRLAATDFAQVAISVQRMREGHEAIASALTSEQLEQKKLDEDALWDEAELGARQAVAQGAIIPLVDEQSPGRVSGGGVGFSPTEPVFATDGDKLFRMWDAETGECLTRLPSPHKGCEALSFSPDGKALIHSSWRYGTEHGEILFRRAPDWEIAWRRDLEDRANEFAFSPDGSTVAVTLQSKSATVLVDTSTGEPVRWFRTQDRKKGQGYRTAARGVVLLNNASLMATSHDDGMISLWNVAKGEHLDSIYAHPGHGIRGLIAFKDGNHATLLSGSAFGILKHLPKANVEILAAGAGGVTTFAQSYNQRHLVVGFDDGTLSLLSLPDVGLLLRRRAHDGQLIDAAISNSGRRLLSSGHDGIRLWNSGRIRAFQGLPPVALGPEQTLAFTNGSSVVSLSLETGLELVSRPLPKPDARGVLWRGSKSSAYGLTISPDGGQLLLLRRNTNRMNIIRDAHHDAWAASPGSNTFAQVSERRTSAAAYSRDGQLLALGTDVDFAEAPQEVRRNGGDAAIYLTRPGTPTRKLTWHLADITGLAFTPDRTHLLSTSRDGTIARWDLDEEGEDPAWVALAPPLMLELAAPAFKNATLYEDLNGRTAAERYRWLSSQAGSGKMPSETHQNSVALLCCAVSPDGRTVTAGHSSGAAIEWDIASGKLLRTQRLHGSRMNACAFSSDGRLFFTASNGERTIRVWATKGWRSLQTINVPAFEVFQTVFDPRGEFAAVAMRDREGEHRILVYDLRAPALPEFERSPLKAILGRTP